MEMIDTALWFSPLSY